MGENAVKALHKHGVLFAFSIIMLCACSSTPESPSAPATPASPSAPAYHPPAISTPAAPAAPVYKPMADDMCGANQLQYLVGKPRTDIPVPLDPGSRRVVCSTCIVTQEYRADRQTIVFNTETGIIESVKCG